LSCFHGAGHLSRVLWSEVEGHYSPVCTCARVCEVFSFSLVDKGGGVQLVYAEHLSLGVGIYFNRRRDRSVVFCLLYLKRGRECTWVYVCVYAHTLTETLEGPEESRWTQSRQICIRICQCVQSTHVYIYAGRRDEIWTGCFFSCHNRVHSMERIKQPHRASATGAEITRDLCYRLLMITSADELRDRHETLEGPRVKEYR